MEKKTKKIIFITVITVCILIIAIYVWIYETNKGSSFDDTEMPCYPAVNFEVQNNTIVVIHLGENPDCNISASELIWENIEIYEKYGNGTLPTGAIDVGDTITNCSGIVYIKWKPTDFIFYSLQIPDSNNPPIPIPSVSLTSSASKQNCTITVGTPTIANVLWADVSYTLIDITADIEISHAAVSDISHAVITKPASGYVTGADTITIKHSGADNWHPSYPLVDNHEYRFTLKHEPTGGIMELVTWTQ